MVAYAKQGWAKYFNKMYLKSNTKQFDKNVTNESTLLRKIFQFNVKIQRAYSILFKYFFKYILLLKTDILDLYLKRKHVQIKSGVYIY